MNAQPSATTQSKLPVAIVVILVLLVACVLLCVCAIVVLALLGPTTGNVFSNIIQEIGTPVP
jgi:small neutral amino acid transporter SnatA (MarC family)